MLALRSHSPAAIARSARPKGSPHDVISSPSAIGTSANRWPSRMVERSRNVVVLWRMPVPAGTSSLAIAALSEEPGRRHRSAKS